jgi:Flp pilus assembly protein protease CpaA
MYKMLAELNNLIVYSIAFLGLAIASYTDLRTREVPDWLNYGLIGTGIGLSLIFSVIYWKFEFIVNSLIGLLILFTIAWIMFYTRQWGGGDSKIIMGLGALIGVDVFAGEIPFLGHFFVNALFVGAAYGMFWSFYLAFKNRKKFMKEFKKIAMNKKIKEIKKWLLILFFVLILLVIFSDQYSTKIILAYFGLLILLTFYVFIFIKSVEKSCMLSYVDPKVLTEGDWVAKEVKVKGKYIAGPKDLGVEKKQIRQLIKLYKEKKIKKVLMKIGIPFVPSFFVAFVITLVYGNLVFLII